MDSEHSRYLASDAEREWVAVWLALAFEDGRLGLAEYDRRVAAAYAAVTWGDLTRLTDDLPQPPESAFRQRLSPAAAAAARPVPPAPVPVGPDRPTHGRPKVLLWLILVGIAGIALIRAGVVWPLPLAIVVVMVVGAFAGARPARRD
jgi:Domain of unknown function (DUF1707)